MFTALILVCSLAYGSDLSACTEDNALTVVRDPATFASPSACAVHGQAYLAATAIGRDLGESEAVKVICRRPVPAILSPAVVSGGASATGTAR